MQVTSYVRPVAKILSDNDGSDLQLSAIYNLKGLRPGSAGPTEVRILFVFDPWRSAILLVAGDKTGNWSGWYRHAIPHAEQLYETYLSERAAEQEPLP